MEKREKLKVYDAMGVYQSPDETFFHSLLLNSPLCARHVLDGRALVTPSLSLARGFPGAERGRKVPEEKFSDKFRDPSPPSAHQSFQKFPETSRKLPERSCLRGPSFLAS